MTDYFKVIMDDEDLRKISNLGLAHLGDAVYELMVRTWLCAHGGSTSKNLHKAAVTYVSAPAQAKAVLKLEPHLTENEKTVLKRGRNAHVNSVPSKSTIGEYHAATGIEALFGYLYLKGQTDRLNELFNIIMEQ